MTRLPKVLAEAEVKREVGRLRAQALEQRAAQEPPAKGRWRPVVELAAPAPGANPLRTLRVDETWRWQPYKPDGARQMRKAGRWQRHDGFGFVNAELPEGAEFWDPDAAPEEEVDQPRLKPYQP